MEIVNQMKGAWLHYETDFLVVRLQASSPFYLEAFALKIKSNIASAADSSLTELKG